jgi:hypothetical protein
MNNLATIPFVYIWVDGSDPHYQMRHKMGGCSSRHRDNGELRYSLRSIERYMPWWKGTLYIVTDNQIPKWLEVPHPRVKLIDHIDIIPPEYLPTHVSNVIEWFLKDIPGLPEYFIAMNDDFMIKGPVEPSTFFTPGGQPIIQWNSNQLDLSEVSLAKYAREKKVWHQSVVYTVRTLEQALRYKFPVTYFLHHGPRIFSKTQMKELFELWRPSLKQSLRQKERSPTIIDTVYAVSYYMAYKGRISPSPRLGHLFDTITDSTNFMQLRYSIQSDTRSTFMCLNDEFTKSIQSEQLQDLYEELYPIPSIYERPTSLVRSVPATPSSPTQPPIQFRFVSFYSEGPPYDKGLPLSIQKEGAIKALQGHCMATFYTPQRLRELGYEYAVREYDDRGCVTENPGCEKLGFFAWKPLILWLELKAANDGDIVMFHDLNISKYPVYQANLETLPFFAKKSLEACGFDFFVPREGVNKRLYHHAKRNVIEELGGAGPFYTNFPQAIVNTIFVRKSQASMELLEEWMEACKVERWITGWTDPAFQTHPGFMWHCPEQAILGAILAKWVATRRWNIPLAYPNVIVPSRNLQLRRLVQIQECAHLEWLPRSDTLAQPRPLQPNLDCMRYLVFSPSDTQSPLEASTLHGLKGRCPIRVVGPSERMNLPWLPAYLLEELEALDMGDILLFHELSVEQNLSNKAAIQSLPETAGGCLDECQFDLWLGWTTAGTLCTNVCIMRKSDATLAFVQEWLAECEDNSHYDTIQSARPEQALHTVWKRWWGAGRTPFRFPMVELPGGSILERRPAPLEYYSVNSQSSQVDSGSKMVRQVV